MLLGAVGSMMSGKKLPYSAMVEYLESTGTQWIDTGVKVTSPKTISIECDAEGGPVSLGIIHNMVAAGTWVGARKTSSTGGDIYTKNYNTLTSFSVTQGRHTYLWDGASGYTVDGVVKVPFSAALGTDSIANISWPIFAAYDFYGPSYQIRSANRLYSAKVYVSGSLVRDFIPIHVGNVGYLYDKVTRKLFGNVGTGNFILGPDI